MLQEFLSSKTARSIFFIIFVGGLFLFSSVAFASLCNHVIFDFIEFPCITTLESAGIIAFAYIFIFGIRFGLKKNNNTSWTVNLTNKIANNDNSHSVPDICKKNIEKMSPEERLELQRRLKKSLE